MAAAPNVKPSATLRAAFKSQQRGQRRVESHPGPRRGNGGDDGVVSAPLPFVHLRHILLDHSALLRWVIPQHLRHNARDWAPVAGTLRQQSRAEVRPGLALVLQQFLDRPKALLPVPRCKGRVAKDSILRDPPQDLWSDLRIWGLQHHDARDSTLQCSGAHDQAHTFCRQTAAWSAPFIACLL